VLYVKEWNQKSRLVRLENKKVFFYSLKTMQQCRCKSGDVELAPGVNFINIHIGFWNKFCMSLFLYFHMQGTVVDVFSLHSNFKFHWIETEDNLVIGSSLIATFRFRVARFYWCKIPKRGKIYQIATNMSIKCKSNGSKIDQMPIKCTIILYCKTPKCTQI
jgi:hypothetical protein